MIDRWAEGKHLVVAVASQNALETAGAALGWLTAYSGDALLCFFVIVNVAVLAIAVLDTWLAAEGIARITRLGVMIQGIVALVHADLALRLEALPAIEYPVIGRIVVVGLTIKVVRRRVVRHRDKGSRSIDHRRLLLS